MIPKYLEQTVMDKSTSLGDHPALPPDEEVPYLLHIVRAAYDEAADGVPEELLDDRRALASELDRLVTECRKREEPITEALQQLCCDLLIGIFDIPEDTVNIDVRLVGECDMSKYRVVPEPTEDFQFYDIDEMKAISDAIYQRRAIDMLISGAAISRMGDMGWFLGKIEGLDPELPELYKAVMRYRRALLFLTEDTVSGTKDEKTGCVDVMIPNEGERVRVSAEGVIFPILMEYAIRGILETASINGLPKDERTAEYVMSKADYRLAENWDCRIGPGVWSEMAGMFADCGFSMDELGDNFVIMELASMNPGNFNSFMSNVLKGTRKGAEMADAFCATIEYNREADQFTRFMTSKSRKYSINDSEFYSPEELLSEDWF